MKAQKFSSRILNLGMFHLPKRTKNSGICNIIPEMEICDFDFDPCGYSMNGINGKALSTIHVTPEDGFSYASHEAMGFEPGSISYNNPIERVLRCFEPLDFYVAVTIFGGYPLACSYRQELEIGGYNCKGLASRNFQEVDCLCIRASCYQLKGRLSKVHPPLLGV